MTDDEEGKATASAYALRKTDEWRRFEIELFWKRSGVFWLVFAAAFTGFGLAIGAGNTLMALTVACFGWAASLTWTLANRGSKVWYENWEAQLQKAEDEAERRLYGTPVLTHAVSWPKNPALRVVHRPVRPWLTGRRFSVSSLLIALSDYTLMLWTGAVLYSFLAVTGVRSTSHQQTLLGAALLLGTGAWGFLTAVGTFRPGPDRVHKSPGTADSPPPNAAP